MADDAAKQLIVPAGIKGGLEFAAILDSHPRVELMFLGEVTDAGADFGCERADVVAEQQAGTARGLHEAHEHADGGGLAGTVAAEERENTSARDVEIEFVDGGLRAVIFCEAARLDDGLVAHGNLILGELDLRSPPPLPSPPGRGRSVSRRGLKNMSWFALSLMVPLPCSRLFPLAEFLGESVAQFFGREIQNHRFADDGFDQRLKPSPAFFAGKDFPLPRDEHASPRP